MGGGGGAGGNAQKKNSDGTVENARAIAHLNS